MKNTFKREISLSIVCESYETKKYVAETCRKSKQKPKRRLGLGNVYIGEIDGYLQHKYITDRIL